VAEMQLAAQDVNFARQWCHLKWKRTHGLAYELDRRRLQNYRSPLSQKNCFPERDRRNQNGVGILLDPGA